MKSQVNKPIALMVTTEKRGVFYGYGFKSDAKTIELENARMCVFWSQDMHGVMGLASIGPSKSCKVSHAVPSVILQDVTATFEVSKEAIEKWESAPWA